MKIVFLDAYTTNPGDLSWKPLAALGELTLYDRTPHNDSALRIGDADAVFVNNNDLTRDIIEKCPNLRFIGAAATGYDNIDVKAAEEGKIAIANIPAYSTDAVAQHTFAFILEIANQVSVHNQAVDDGEWYDAADFCFTKAPLTLLAGKTLGIIGYGNIGKKVAEIARAFGMAVNIYSQDREAAVKSDFLSLHCPATDENKGFVNSEFIGGMKDGAVLINTARGALIVENDLAEALKAGKLSAAGLDVLIDEPPGRPNPLVGIPNCWITPHIAWVPKDVRQRVIDVCAANLKSFMEGGRLNRIK